MEVEIRPIGVARSPFASPEGMPSIGRRRSMPNDRNPPSHAVSPSCIDPTPPVLIAPSPRSAKVV